MSIKLFDRVKQKTTTSGSGTITLTSSVDAFLDFSGIYEDSEQLFYTIENTTDFEVGIGTYSSNTIARNTVLKSSNDDQLLDLPGDLNTYIFVTYPASGAVFTSGTRVISNIDGIHFPDGATQTIAYTGQSANLSGYATTEDVAEASGYLQGFIDSNESDISEVSGLLYNNWNIDVTGNSSQILTDDTLSITGVGLSSVSFDSDSNLITISGIGGGGSMDSWNLSVDNDTSVITDDDTVTLTGAGLTIVSKVGNTVTFSGEEQDLSSFATTGELNSVSGYLQGQIDENSSSSGYLQSQIDINTSDISSVSGELYKNWSLSVTGSSYPLSGLDSLTVTGIDGTSLSFDPSSYTLAISGSNAEIYTAGSGLTLVGNEFNTSGTGNFNQILFGDDNIKIGRFSYANNTGISMGWVAGLGSSNSSNHIFIGTSAGENSDNNDDAIFIGFEAGSQAENSTDLVLIGTDAGFQSFNNDESIAIGSSAGYQMSRSQDSVFIGRSAAYQIKDSSDSIAIGCYTARHASGDHNIYIGHEAGQSASGSFNIELVTSGITTSIIGNNNYKLNIGNMLIGDLDSKKLSVGSGSISPNATLDIVSNSSGDIGLIVRGSESHAANLQEWQDNSENILAFVDTRGVVSGSGFTFQDGITQTIAYTGQSGGGETYTAGSGLTLDDSEFNVYGGTGLLDTLYFPASGTGVGINITLSPSRFTSQVPQNSSQPRILVGFGNDEYQSYEELDGTVVVGHFNSSGALGRSDGNLVFGNTSLQSSSGCYGNRIFGKSNMNSASNSHANIIVGFNSAFGLTDTTTAYIISSNQGANNASNIDGTVVIGQQGAISATDFTESLSLGNAASIEASGNRNIVFGYAAGYQMKGDNNIDIHNNSSFLSIIGSNSNKLNIGSTIVGDTSSKLLAIGNVGSSDLTPDATLEILPNSSTDVGLIIQGATSHAANLQEWQDSNENILAFVDIRGAISGSGFTFQDGVTQTIAYTGQSGGGSTYTAGSGLTLDGDEFNVYGGTGNFKQIYYNEHDPILIGSPDFNIRPILANGPNIFIGHNAGRDYVADEGSSTTGNLAIGVNAASGMVYGRQSVFIGSSAGNSTSGIVGSTLIGANAAQGSTDFSNTTVIGRGARDAENLNSCCIIGESLTAGSMSSAIGTVAIGTQAAYEATNLNYSIAIGELAGQELSGDYNLAFGYFSALQTKGTNNIDIHNNISTEVIIGSNDNKLNIGKTIIGDISSKLLAIGNVGASNLTPDATLEILPNASTDIGLIVQGTASHTANLQEWQDSSENTLSYVDSNGGVSGVSIYAQTGYLQQIITTDGFIWIGNGLNDSIYIAGNNESDVRIGTDIAAAATGSANNVAIGSEVNIKSHFCSSSVLIGSRVMESGYNCTSNVAIGQSIPGPGGYATELDNSLVIGELAGVLSSGCNGIIAIGSSAGYDQINSSSSYGIGANANRLSSGDYNIAFGFLANTQTYGFNNIGFGYNANRSVVGNNNIEIVTNGPSPSIIGTASNKINIEGTIVGDTSNKLLAIGDVGSSDLTPEATLEIKAAASDDIGLIVQAPVSNTANLQEWRNSLESGLLFVGPEGGLGIPNNVPSDTTNILYNDSGTLKFNGAEFTTGTDYSWNLSVTGSLIEIDNEDTVTFSGQDSISISRSGTVVFISGSAGSVTGEVGYDWSVGVTGSTDIISSGDVVTFTGIGLVDVTYDSSSKTVYFSGIEAVFDDDLEVSLSDSKTFGRYEDGDTIPASGKTAREVIELSIAEAIAPTVNISSSTSVAFNQTGIDNEINLSYTINTLSASVDSVSLDYRRGSSASWTTLSTDSTNPTTYDHQFTDTNYNTSGMNYRYIVTDTAGASNTGYLTITPASYSAPTISWDVTGNDLSGIETNNKREVGNVNSQIAGSITRNSANVDLLSYTIQYRVNNGSWTDIGSEDIGPGNSTIPSTGHDPTSDSTATDIDYRIRVLDEYQEYLSSYVYSSTEAINFFYYIFYGPVSSAPTTSDDVRAISNIIYTDGSNPFELDTGDTEINFSVAMPDTISITQVLDLDSLSADITSEYINNPFDVDDAGGNAVGYNVYTMTISSPYSSSHRHEVTRS